MHRRWGTSLVLVIVAFVAIMPTLEPVCDTTSGDGHGRSHLHAIPGIVAEGSAVSRAPLVGAVPPVRSFDRLVEHPPSIFVPPRS